MSHQIADYADQQGRAYTEALTNEHRAEHGHYLTPPEIARYMAATLTTGWSMRVVRLLDPAAGAGILACAACEALAASPTPPEEIHLTCYEVDEGLRSVLTDVLAKLKAAMHKTGVRLVVSTRFEDFVFANAEALEAGLFPSGEQFDAIISNPPYFKVPKSDPRAIACNSVVHGQPNIYGFFMAISAAMLREGGRLNFIVPRSFASGPYFRLFRERFFGMLQPQVVHLFNSRTDAFSRDEVLQENIILQGVRATNWSAREGGILTIIASHGLRDIDAPEVFGLPLAEVLDMQSKDKVLCIPGSQEQVDVFHRLRYWSGSLHRHGWEISTGPVIPFRATEVIVDTTDDETIPLLWIQNVRAMATSWPVATRKSQYLKNTADAAAIVLPNKNYVLLWRFSAKEQDRRLTAAPVFADALPFAHIGLENHLNYVHKPKGTLTREEVAGLAAIFNSRLIDTWFRAINGNTQVSATEIRAMPLPAVETIRAIGAAVAGAKTLEEIDEVVARIATEDMELIDA
ncbi:MAG: methyltransferase [Paraburkholderia sp.]|uniref:Eco57I restriction-modification methylase domain-containing protein n=1 Tax=Paraburkholderia sp. TaxID=1926495 RepID=UPI00120F926B|nr:N-6 DNA methylase [Paraburkholderia sp.]TAL95248.1 MAG: methyltransferase [Paraburkholderia sp.]